eukprot:CAMPEP_0202866958 /NCGR_PEP_ID=MMETSP1391-20130828/8449_1 /ASSEMBLY_ACC=CAM_ASM_000867 /TAXON_ID=1034604 /ORGANISM="Chlamydomonas leiostraca, Strain SAG 11-49" /LENGTH=805 /DNA_ID=CAMNT_0049546951 /DNA_START=68 /DNA_END=2485 /DNA_ORIENTATION=+
MALLHSQLAVSGKCINASRATAPRIVVPVVRRAQCSTRKLAVARTALAEPPSALSSFASIMEDEDENILDEDQEVVQVDAHVDDETLRVENLGLSEETVAALYKRGIQALFPIQKSVFAPAMDGRDLIGRAKTGSGKTLAFALPVVEGLLAEDRETKPARGRPPRAIILAPTRELANQVAREFETACPKLKVVSVYGGVSIGGQIRDLERGADVIVGTPGRVIDLIERDKLVLDKVRYAILDEADQMLDMGFEEDMEKILSYVPEQRQTLLFSATLPKWVNKVARRFQVNPLLVDLVGEENTGRLADTIRLLVMQVEHSQKMNALMDAITLHAGTGKSIVFVNTKMKADEICEEVNKSHPCVVLHGDISQAQRDRSLALFREGKYPVLVATDVAARGLDIPLVDLVVHYDVPVDNEAFLHRSGRTGRAGNKGTAVVLFTEKEVRTLGLILRQTKVENAELVGAPEPREVLTRCAKSVLGQLDKVDGDVIDFFVPAAEKLLASPTPSRVLAAALAALGGFRRAPQPRSLLTYEEGLVTARIMGPRGAIDGWNSLNKVLKAVLKKAKYERDIEYAIGKIKTLEDREKNMDGAAFDLPVEEAALILDSDLVIEAAAKLGYVLDKPRTLPLDVKAMAATGDAAGALAAAAVVAAAMAAVVTGAAGMVAAVAATGPTTSVVGAVATAAAATVTAGATGAAVAAAAVAAVTSAVTGVRAAGASAAVTVAATLAVTGAAAAVQRRAAGGAGKGSATWSNDEFYSGNSDSEYFDAAPAKSAGGRSGASRGGSAGASRGAGTTGPTPKSGWAQW